MWYFMMEALRNSQNFHQSSNIIWLVFLIGEDWVHIVLFVLRTYWYWFHTWKSCILKGHKVLTWVLNFLSFWLLPVEPWEFERKHVCEWRKVRTQGNAGLFFPIWIFHNCSTKDYPPSIELSKLLHRISIDHIHMSGNASGWSFLSHGATALVMDM